MLEQIEPIVNPTCLVTPVKPLVLNIYKALNFLLLIHNEAQKI